MAPRRGRPTGRCQVCKHESRALIEAARISGIGLDTVAQKFGVNRHALWRHMAKHVSEETMAMHIASIPLSELAETAAKEGTSLIGYLAIMRATLMTQFQLAASLNDRNGTAILSGRLVEVLREMGKLTGELLNTNAVTNINNVAVIFNSPVFAQLEEMLIEALAPYPAALAAVMAGLERLDEQRAVSSVGAPKIIEHHNAA